MDADLATASPPVASASAKGKDVVVDLDKYRKLKRRYFEAVEVSCVPFPSCSRSPPRNGRPACSQIRDDATAALLRSQRQVARLHDEKR
jgi:hypothetical protein